MESYSLDDYLGRAWASHIAQFDGSLPLDHRIGCVDHRDIVNTFVGLLDHYMSNIPCVDIYERSMQEVVYTCTPATHLHSLLLDCYAEHILEILHTVKRDHCYGCGCTERYGPPGHPSQTQHTCLDDLDDLLDLYFMECLDQVNPDILLKKYAEKLYYADELVTPDTYVRKRIVVELELHANI